MFFSSCPTKTIILEINNTTSSLIFKRHSSSKRWQARQIKDHFTRAAAVQGLKSRAAFKLLQIDEKYHIFKSGQTVVDLGYAPGSWSQVCLISWQFNRHLTLSGGSDSNSTKRSSSGRRHNPSSAPQRRFYHTGQLPCPRYSGLRSGVPPRSL